MLHRGGRRNPNEVREGEVGNPNSGGYLRVKP